MARDAATNGHPDTRTPRQRDDDNEVPEGWRWTLPRYLGMAAFLGMVLFWIWVFANGDSIDHPNQFDDPVYLEAAEAACAARQAELAELPLATAAEDPVERGQLLERGTAIIEDMLADLRALGLPSDPEGAEVIPLWLADYEVYMADRRAYAEVLAEGRDEAFLLSASESAGGRVTDVIGTVAEVNNMPSCAPSGDV